MGKTKRSRKKKTSKPKNEEEPVADPVIEEIVEPIEPVQTAEVPKEELPPPEEEPIELVTLDVVDINQYKMLDAISELPEPEKYSQRWYGEIFLPLYTKSRNKLRKLAGLT